MDKDKIVIVDYGMGNLNSVKKKFEKLGVETITSSNVSLIASADKLVLPGVGHFQKAMENIKQRQLLDILNNMVLVRKIPVLGICLGMQIMANHSEEGDVDGLGWIAADVVRFKIKDQLKYKIPHMGWNNALIERESHIFKGISPNAMYYFVHSYHIKCNNKEDILTTTEYEYSFTSAIQKGNILGVQFHPEKSHDWGEQIFKNFADL